MSYSRPASQGLNRVQHALQSACIALMHSQQRAGVRRGVSQVYAISELALHLAVQTCYHSKAGTDMHCPNAQQIRRCAFSLTIP